MLGSSLNCLVPLTVFNPTITCEMVLPYPLSGFSVSAGVNSVTSPSYTSLVSLIRKPIARLKPPLRTSVFFTSPLNTSDPTMGQKGTLLPSS